MPSVAIPACVAAIVLAAAGACGGPALQNVPAPDKAAAAGFAAGLAGAAALAQEADGGPTPEKKQPEKVQREVKVKERVPAGALDRLDDKRAGGATATDDAEPPVAPDDDAPAPPPALDFRPPPKP